MNEINFKNENISKNLFFEKDIPKLDTLVKKGIISASTAEKVKISKTIIENKYLKFLEREKAKKINWNKIENYLSSIKTLTKSEKKEIIAKAELKESQLYKLLRRKLSVDNFEIIKLIGKGGFGEVNICRYKENGKIYAMKKITFEKLKYKNGLLHVQTEKDILSLNNDNLWITQLRYSFIDNSNLYLIMDFCPGGDLMNYLIERDILQESEARFYIAEIILCVHSLHKMNCIHRDLKPDNILIGEDGHLKLSDFGLSYISNERLFPLTEIKSNEINQKGNLFLKNSINFNNNNDENKIESNSINAKNNQNINNKQIITFSNVGSPDYVAPEVIKNEGYGEEIDWWSVGAIFYEMLIGLPPFFSKSPQMTCEKIRQYDKYLSVPEEREISSEAKELIFGFLTKPSKRLGYKGIDEIKKHCFFNNFDWEKIREMKPPFIPKLSSPDDTKYFKKRINSSIRLTNKIKGTNIFFNKEKNIENNKILLTKFCFQYNKDLIDIEKNLYNELMDLIKKEVQIKTEKKMSFDDVSSEAKSSNESLNNLSNSFISGTYIKDKFHNFKLFPPFSSIKFSRKTLAYNRKKSLSILPIRNLMNKEKNQKNQNNLKSKEKEYKRIKLKRGPGKIYSIHITSNKNNLFNV